MKLFVQPGDNIAPLVKAIQSARKTLHIAIFRHDREEIERALKDAVKRGVAVFALVAHTNRGGEENLRKLEMRLLDYGVSVARTGDDMARYHDKLMIVDRQQLFLLAFNFTRLDLERSRSFGIATRNRRLVEEAAKLFEADAQRRPYAIRIRNLIVSPLNARRRLSDFIRQAGKQLLIYDPKISDRSMIALLHEKARAGVEIKIIGKVTHNRQGLEVRKLSRLRLHARTMIRDGSSAFLGSQSLRRTELESRREVGIIFHDRRAVCRLTRIFQEDWAAAEPLSPDPMQPHVDYQNAARTVANRVARELPPIAPAVKSALQELAGVRVNGSLDARKIQIAVKGCVERAVAETVEEVAKELVNAAPDRSHK